MDGNSRPSRWRSFCGIKTAITLTLICSIVVIIIICVAVLTKQSTKTTYHGNSFVLVHAKTPEQKDFLQNFGKLNLKVEVLGFPAGNQFTTHMNVGPNALSDVEEVLQKNNITFKVLYHDLQRLIDDEEEAIAKRKSEYKSDKFDFGNYHPYQQIVDWLKKTADSSSLMNVSSIGETYEKRSIYMVHISSNSSVRRPVIYMNCGIHAREWISPAVCLWIINQLINERNEDEQSRQLRELYDWLIVPVFNPDGYVYTWTSDRIWRKNRQPSSHSSCIGVDLNRNYQPDFHLSSNDSCSNNYAGTHPSSEKETQSLESSLLPYRSRLKVGIFVHSFSQMLLSPFGVNSSLPKEYPEMERVMAKGVAAIRDTYGTEYQYGSIFNTLYQAAGTALDYFYLNMGVVHSYLIELRDEGSYGFILPIDQIIPTATETWNGIKAMIFAIS